MCWHTKITHRMRIFFLNGANRQLMSLQKSRDEIFCKKTELKLKKDCNRQSNGAEQCQTTKRPGNGSMVE